MKRITNAIPFVCALALLASLNAQADASFTGLAGLGMAPTPTTGIVNAFGFSGPYYTQGPANVDPLGLSSGTTSLSDGQITADGSSSYDYGDVIATASGKETFRLANLTGSGGGTPAAQSLDIKVNWAVTYNIQTALTQQPGGIDAASEELVVSAAAGSWSQTLLDITVSGNNSVSTVAGDSFVVTLPANSVTPVTITCTLKGEAFSLMVPEPSTFALVCLGSVSLLAHARRCRQKA